MRQLLSISLAFIVTLSSLNFSLGLHFCSGQLVNIALLKEAKPCDHGKGKVVDCPVHGKMVVAGDENSCCDDRTVFVEGEEHETFSQTDLQTDIEFKLPSVALEGNVTNVAFSKLISFFNYRPPPLLREIHILFQSFLN